MKAIVKSKEEIEQIAEHFNPNQGWVLKGQYFPIENLIFSGKEIDVEPLNKNFPFCYCSNIDGEWHFFSVDAIKFIKTN